MLAVGYKQVIVESNSGFFFNDCAIFKKIFTLAFFVVICFFPEKHDYVIAV